MPKPQRAPTGIAAQEVTAAELAAVLGLSERRVRELRTDGSIPGLDAGRFNLVAAVSAYCAHMRPASGRGAAGGATGAAAVDEQRVRLLSAQADAREMLNAQMRGETVLQGDLEAACSVFVDAIRTRTLALPTRSAPLVIGKDSLAEVRDILTGLVHDALGDLSSAGISAATIEHARKRAGVSDSAVAGTGEVGTTA